MNDSGDTWQLVPDRGRYGECGQRLSECTLKAESAWATSRLELECEKEDRLRLCVPSTWKPGGAIQGAGEM